MWAIEPVMTLGFLSAKHSIKPRSKTSTIQRNLKIEFKCKNISLVRTYEAKVLPCSLALIYCAIQFVNLILVVD